MFNARRLKRVARSLFWRDDVESEIDAEMRLHVELEAEELIQQGMPASEARRQAAIRFGGVEQRKEEALEQGSLQWIENTRRDVRIAARTLRRQPAFATTAVLALALAIAVNTTMYSVLDAMINPAVGANHPEQLYRIRYFGRFGRRLGVSAVDRALEGGGKTYSAYTGAWAYPYRIVERGDILRHGDILRVRPNFFATLGIAAIEGTLTAPADPAASGTVAIISDGLRAELFPDGSSPLGKSFEIDGIPYRISGVARRYAASEELDQDVWLFREAGREMPVNVIRLRPGVSRDDAERELSLLASRIALGEGEKTSDARFALTPTARQFEVQQFHWALIGAAIAVLLVACTNLANLQLARGLGRAGELAVRSALGASRRQVVAQLMIESGVIAVAALVLAVLLSIAGNALVRVTIPANIGRYVVEPHITWRTVVFAAAAAVTSLVLIGLAPAIRVSRLDINPLLKSRAGTGSHRSNQRIYGALVIVQIALTLPLVCAAVLLSVSAMHLASPDYRKQEVYGFDTRPLVRASLAFPPSPSAKVPIAELSGALVSRARMVPGVVDAAVAVRHNPQNDTFSVDDTDGSLREIVAFGAAFQIVSPSFFRTMGLPIERGQAFSEGGHSEPLVVMDRGTGWYLWPRSSPIGRSIKMGNAHSSQPWVKVVGIVGDSLNDDARQLARVRDTLRVNTIYEVMTVNDSAPASGFPTIASLTVRANGNPQRVASALRKALSGTPSLLAPRVVTLEDVDGIPERVAVLRFIAGLFTTFALIALGLSSLGVYGIVAQSVMDRQREVAVRVALGASSRSIIHALIRHGNVLVLAGVAFGLYATKETMGWLGSFIGDADATNALLFGTLCVALFSAMVLSAFIPAYRATKLDPMETLRAE